MDEALRVLAGGLESNPPADRGDWELFIREAFGAARQAVLLQAFGVEQSPENMPAP